MTTCLPRSTLPSRFYAEESWWLELTHDASMVGTFSLLTRAGLLTLDRRVLRLSDPLMDAWGPRLEGVVADGVDERA